MNKGGMLVKGSAWGKPITHWHRACASPQVPLLPSPEFLGTGLAKPLPKTLKSSFLSENTRLDGLTQYKTMWHFVQKPDFASIFRVGMTSFLSTLQSKAHFQQ